MASLRKKIKNLFRRKIVVIKQREPTPPRSGVAALELTTKEDQLYAYKRDVWVYRAVQLIATSIAAVPIILLKGEERVEEHPALKLLNTVNGFMTKYDLFETTVSYLELTGDCYWLLRGGPPLAIFPLRPDRVTINLDEDGYPKEYVYSVSGQPPMTYPKDRIIHFKYFSPLDDHYGQSPISPSELAIILDRYALAYNKVFFENAARPDIVLLSEDEMDEDERERLRQEWESAYGGVEQAHRPAVLTGGLKPQELSKSPKEAGFLEGRQFARDEILEAFGVHPALVGAMTVPKAGFYEIKKAFWEFTLLPKLNKIIETLNEFYLVKFPNTKGMRFSYDLFNVESLRPSADVESRVDVRLVQFGIMKINEVRKRRNLPPVDWGEEPPLTAPIRRGYTLETPEMRSYVRPPKARVKEPKET